MSKCLYCARPMPKSKTRPRKFCTTLHRVKFFRLHTRIRSAEQRASGAISTSSTHPRRGRIGKHAAPGGGEKLQELT